MVATTTTMTTMTTTTMMMTTRITTIEEETHLRLKTERMVVISDILAWRDGRTDGRTYGRTDTASYRDAMDASKNMRDSTNVFLLNSVEF